MSEQTWLEEFMPTPASSAVGTEAEAIAHCLQKWKGYRKEAKESHENTVAFPKASNCALCLRHYKGCDTCSLALARDGVACDERTDNEEVSPYHAYVGLRFNFAPTPEPMIAALEAAAIYAKENAL